MRILALGGAGEMGAAAATVLAADETVSEVVIADRDLHRAETVADRLAAKAAACQLDATDNAALVAAMRKCDVVVNTVGPFFRFGVPILTAAIDARCNYLDICDDPEPTLQMLDLDHRARSAGVTALIGMGASPGIANLLAVIAGRQLDTVESLITGWNIVAAHPDATVGTSPSAALVHGMAQISGTIPITRGRKLVHRRALQQIAFTYPGIGNIRGRSFGHPEAVTLHRAFPDLRDNTNVVVGDSATLAALSALRVAIDARLLSLDRAARLTEWLQRLLPGNAAQLIKSGSPPPLFAVAIGTRRGQPATAATALAQLPGLTMAATTGIPLAVATTLFAASPRPGVHTPETLIDPNTFFTALAPHCIGMPAPTAMTATTTSWAPTADNSQALNASLLTALLTAT
jgi:saccharopine dehydrogenase-like NADP-dependent oxidoreductase